MAEKADSEVAVVDAAEEVPLPCELPMPPFTSEMGYTKDSELKCFWAGCQKKRKGFWSLLSHIKGYHTKNRMPKEWLTSYFIQEANKEQKQLRLARTEKMKAHVKSKGERGKGSGTGRVVGQWQQAMEQQADVGKQALTDGIVARPIDEATNYTYVSMPSESSKSQRSIGIGVCDKCGEICIHCRAKGIVAIKREAKRQQDDPPTREDSEGAGSAARVKILDRVIG